ncbi:hypothetical protein D3C87_2205530 [compost metagenome]
MKPAVTTFSWKTSRVPWFEAGMASEIGWFGSEASISFQVLYGLSTRAPSTVTLAAMAL